MRYSKGFLLVILSLMVNFSFAQISAAERAVKRAEQKVADKIVEKTFNGIVDKLFGSDSTATTTKDTSVKTDSTVTANSTPFGGLFSSKTVDKKFEFNLTLDMEIQTTDKKGKGDVISMMAHYATDSAYVGTEMAEVINIMDFSDMKNYAIIGGKVTVFNLQSFIDKANKKAKKKEKENDDEEYEFKKTGKTEKIAGYTCDEYIMESKEMKGNFWITNDIGINPAAYARTFAANPSFKYPDNQKGIILKMKMEDLKEKTTTTMNTKEVITETRTYDLSKYKASDLSKIGF